MLPTKPDDSAYPHPNGTEETGLTKREYMATKILAGFAASDVDSLPDKHSGETGPRAYAMLAVDWADLLIAALNKPKE